MGPNFDFFLEIFISRPNLDFGQNFWVSVRILIFAQNCDLCFDFTSKFWVLVLISTFNQNFDFYSNFRYLTISCILLPLNYTIKLFQTFLESRKLYTEIIVTKGVNRRKIFWKFLFFPKFDGLLLIHSHSPYDSKLKKNYFSFTKIAVFMCIIFFNFRNFHEHSWHGGIFQIREITPVPHSRYYAITIFIRCC